MSNRTAVSIAAIGVAADGLSQELDVRSFRVVGFHMPADWTAAALTFKARARDTDTAYNVYDSDGTELTVSAADDRYVVPTPAEAEALAGIAYLTVRSGTTATPVQQGAAREIIVVLERNN